MPDFEFHIGPKLLGNAAFPEQLFKKKDQKQRRIAECSTGTMPSLYATSLVVLVQRHVLCESVAWLLLSKHRLPAVVWGNVQSSSKGPQCVGREGRDNWEYALLSMVPSRSCEAVPTPRSSRAGTIHNEPIKPGAGWREGLAPCRTMGHRRMVDGAVHITINRSQCIHSQKHLCMSGLAVKDLVNGCCFGKWGPKCWAQVNKIEKLDEYRS